MAKVKITQSPSWETEVALASCKAGQIAGVDEAGRGPWAGPVVAAAVIFPAGERLDGLNDSKKLNAERRNALYDRIQASASIGIGIVSVGEIDRINILQATMAAMRMAVTELPEPPQAVLIDGNRCPKLHQKAVPVVQGDSLCPSIAAASIIAKVTRDRLMIALGEEFPDYGWCDNKGYGTRAHAEAIARHGVTLHHRRSFAPVRAALERARHESPDADVY